MPVYSKRASTATGSNGSASGWIPLDQFETPFNVGFGVAVQGSAKFSVQHTFDDVLDPSVTPVAFDHSTVSGKLAAIDGNYAFGMAAIRIQVVSASGNDGATLTVRQVGNQG